MSETGEDAVGQGAGRGSGAYGSVIVRCEPGTLDEVHDCLADVNGVTIRHVLEGLNAIAIDLPDGRTYQTAAEIYRTIPHVMTLEDNTLDTLAADHRP